MTEKWKIIPDIAVRHIWGNASKNSPKNEISVSPDWYAENGIPIDGETGEDFIYLRTEILEKPND